MEDLETLVLNKLGAFYDRKKIERLQALAAQLHAEREALGDAVKRGRISGQEFAVEANELLHTYLVRVANVLGPADYERLLGVPPGEPIDLVDPAVAGSTSYHD